MFALLSRLYQAFYSPPKPDKEVGAIKFGVLGAAQTTPLSLMIPALSHPEVVVQAIAARDRKRAEEFAKKHGIPEVKDTYQDILNDPNIDAIFIPLPNSLHFEWAVRSIRAGKHVLLEKPSVNNAQEAQMLYALPELQQPNAPIILEAFHNRFHPAVHKMLSFVSPADVTHVHAESMLPSWLTDKDNIGYNYALGGGTLMHLGTYNMALMRMIFAAEPEECLSAEVDVLDADHDRCDTSVKTQFRFPQGVGEVVATMRGPWLWKPSEVRVTHREVVVPDKTIPETEEKVRTRVVTLHGFVHAVIWHRIDIKDSYVVRERKEGRTVKSWTETSSYKAYSYKEAGGEFAELPGESWWMSYRYQLEEFVNKVKGRETRGHWISGQDSANQMKMIDMAYEKTGLGLRPTSEFR